MPDTSDVFFETLVGSMQGKTRQAVWLIDEIRALQGIAIPESIAALDRWSDEPRPGWNIALRISQGALIYRNGRDHCELEIPATLAKPLRVPTTPDHAFEQHWIQAGARSYSP